MTIRAGLGARDLPEAEWDGLARRGFHRHAWFRLAEANSWEPRHVAVLDGARPRALFPAFRQDRVLHGDLAARWLGPLRAPLHAIGLRLRPSLAVVLPYGQSSEPLGDAASLSAETMHAVLEALEDTARRDGARAVVFPYVDPDAEPLRRVARERGYVEAFVGSTAVLDVPWISFEEYLAGRSKSVRQTIRRELEELRARGVEVRQETEVRELAAALDDLYREWYRGRNGRGPELPGSFFSSLAEVVGDDLAVQVTRIEGRVAAASVWAAAGGVMDAGFASFVDRRPGAVYFNELVYAPLRLAFARGWSRLELGPSSLAPKSLRGARLRPRFALVRGTNAAAHGALAALARVVSGRNRGKEST